MPDIPPQEFNNSSHFNDTRGSEETTIPNPDLNHPHRFNDPMTPHMFKPRLEKMKYVWICSRNHNPLSQLSLVTFKVDVMVGRWLSWDSDILLPSIYLTPYLRPRSFWILCKTLLFSSTKGTYPSCLLMQRKLLCEAAKQNSCSKNYIPRKDVLHRWNTERKMRQGVEGVSSRGLAANAAVQECV